MAGRCARTIKLTVVPKTLRLASLAHLCAVLQQSGRACGGRHHAKDCRVQRPPSQLRRRQPSLRPQQSQRRLAGKPASAESGQPKRRAVGETQPGHFIDGDPKKWPCLQQDNGGRHHTPLAPWEGPDANINFSGTMSSKSIDGLLLSAITFMTPTSGLRTPRATLGYTLPKRKQNTQQYSRSRCFGLRGPGKPPWPYTSYASLNLSVSTSSRSTHVPSESGPWRRGQWRLGFLRS